MRATLEHYLGSDIDIGPDDDRRPERHDDREVHPHPRIGPDCHRSSAPDPGTGADLGAIADGGPGLSPQEALQPEGPRWRE